MRKGTYAPSDERRMNALARLVDEHGVAYTAKLFARVLLERFSSDPMATTIMIHLLNGITRAEKEEAQ